MCDGPPTYQYPLPVDFYKFRGLEYQRNYPQNSQNVTLNPFNFRNRNEYDNYLSSTATPNLFPRYRIVGNQLWLKAPPQAGAWFQMWYVPRSLPLVETATITLLAFPAGQSLTMTTTIPSNGGVLPPQTFTTASSNTTTNATALAAWITEFNGLYITATATGNVVTMQIINTQQPFSIAFTNVSPSFQMYPGPVWSNTVDGVEGWENYIIVRAAQMALLKEESLESWNAMGQELAMIKQQIIDDATNRNAGDPATTTVSGEGTATGGGWGYGSGYGFGWG